jgi:hypothetical protein
VNIEYDLVRAYFEGIGFLIRHAKKNSREVEKKRPLLPFFEIINPSVSESTLDLSFRLFTGDVMRIKSGCVSFLGWHDSSFSHALLNSDSRLIKFLRKELNEERLAFNDPRNSLMESYNILIVPALPKLEAKSKELFDYLKSLSIDGVLTMSSVLENLLRNTLENSTSSGNSVFHMLKLLKAYGLASEPQLDIFEK